MQSRKMSIKGPYPTNDELRESTHSSMHKSTTTHPHLKYENITNINNNSNNINNNNIKKSHDKNSNKKGQNTSIQA